MAETSRPCWPRVRRCMVSPFGLPNQTVRFGYSKDSHRSMLEGVSTTVAPKQRVLAAALSEFAEHGVAGARVDRIARAAKTSKERVYAYFRSKEELYVAVAADQLQQVMDSTSLDPADLPGYVGELFDFYIAHPEMLR